MSPSTSTPSNSTSPPRAQTVYFAYGAYFSNNKHFAEMAHRCPDSRYLGIGTLHGYAYDKLNLDDPWDVVPCPPWSVKGFCYLISENDERRLDEAEGVKWAYEKHSLAVEVNTANALISGRTTSEVDGLFHKELEQKRNQNSNSMTVLLPYHDKTVTVPITALVYRRNKELSP
ncbi:hypothetical protein DL95DRAFT_400325 [Leptodontidium sp. 2 PMI_412]|nr:hypothetical protein DL95DRAFT_400325 [Leptodontidium sp. 2 PMI_412]